MLHEGGFAPGTASKALQKAPARALEGYFAERPEAKALARMADFAFGEWDDPRDADYDRL